MPATPNCKPWCDDHQNDEDDTCNTESWIYHNGDDEWKMPPAPGTTAAMFYFPDIASIKLVACQSEEDEQPVLSLQFYAAGADDPAALLSLDKDVIEELQAELGAALRKFF